MNFDKHEALARTPSRHTCGAMHFFCENKNTFAQQQQQVLGVINSQWKQKFYCVKCTYNFFIPPQS